MTDENDPTGLQRSDPALVPFLLDRIDFATPGTMNVSLVVAALVAAAGGAMVLLGDGGVGRVGTLLYPAGLAGMVSLFGIRKILDTAVDTRQRIVDAYLQSEHYAHLVNETDVVTERMRKWTISPDAARYLVAIIGERRPRLVVQLGAGNASVILASALRAADPDARLVCIEHLEERADESRAALVAAGLDNAEVRQAPLVELADGEFRGVRWYPDSVIEDLRQIDLLLVDGPPSKLQGPPTKRVPRSRLPVLRLSDRLSDRAVVVIDDTQRKEENQLAYRWGEVLGTSPVFLRAEKGFARISRD